MSILRRYPLIVMAILASVLLVGCAPGNLQPLAFGNPPWSDGEVTQYAIQGAGGRDVGSGSWTWTRNGTGWQQAYSLTRAGQVDEGSVVLGPDLAPVSSWRQLAGKKFQASYQGNQVTIQAGDSAPSQLVASGVPVDNDASLQIARALPLTKGYATRYTDVIPTSGQQAQVTLSVTGAETVTVPAGSFVTWHTVLDFGTGQHDAWYQQDSPHYLVKYLNRASGAMFALSAPAQPGAVGSVPQPGATAEPAGFSWPIVVTTAGIQLPLMILFPVALAWWLARRDRRAWRLVGFGALTFVLSQVGHIPFNLAIGLIGGGRGAALWPLPWLALAAGLSAGVFEEGARWLMLRFVLKDARGWRAALQFGAGHGGCEAVIFGVLAAISFITMLIIPLLPQSQLGAAADQVRAASDAYWRMAWYLPVVGGVERLFAIAFHLAMSVLVMRSFTERRIGYWFAAVGAHAALDWWAVWSAAKLGVVGTEAGVAVGAVAAVALIWFYRPRAASSEDELRG